MTIDAMYMFITACETGSQQSMYCACLSERVRLVCDNRCNVHAYHSVMKLVRDSRCTVHVNQNVRDWFKTIDVMYMFMTACERCSRQSMYCTCLSQRMRLVRENRRNVHVYQNV